MRGHYQYGSGLVSFRDVKAKARLMVGRPRAPLELVRPSEGRDIMTIHHVSQSDNIPDKYIPTIIEWLNTCTRNQLGLLGELIALDWLTNTGYLVERSRGCDLVAGDTGSKTIYKVEVKTARMSADGTYQFVLFKRDHTDHKISEFVVLLCVCPDGYIHPYVVPVSACLLMSKIDIPSDPRAYSGKWAQYSNIPGTLSLNK